MLEIYLLRIRIRSFFLLVLSNETIENSGNGDERQQEMPEYVFGYHGTTTTGAQTLLERRFELDPAERNPPRRLSRWLGRGLYFFQDSQRLAEDWAREKVANRGGSPAVLKARIDLRNCLDLLDPNVAILLQSAHLALRTQGLVVTQKPLTVIDNEVKTRKWDDDSDWKKHGLNYLDYRVIEDAITSVADAGKIIDSVRAAFLEGTALYSCSWLFDKAHVAIAVRPPFLRMEPLEILPVT